jgi:iron complex outermembrane receptor protein
VNDQLSFTLGGRWTSDEKDADFSNVVNNPFVIALSVRDNENRPGLTVDDSKFTYFANASYFPIDDTMLFATVSTGYKSGGFNTDGTFPALTEEQRVFAEEDTTNYEVGIKTQLFDNTLQLNATLFRMDIEGFQDRAFDGISFITRNVGELRQQGVEADFVWAPLDQLTFNGGLSYLDSEFQDYRNASPLPGGPVQDLTGQRAHFAPEWQGSLVADWTDAFTPITGTEYFLRGETQYVGDQNIGGNTNQNPQSFQEGYHLFNARIGLRADDERWEVNLFGKNLGDEGYCLTIFDQPFGAQLGGLNPVANTIPQRCAVGAPQTWGVQLKLRN